MTQQNETQQQDASGPEQPEQLGPPRPDLAESGQEAPPAQPGTPQPVVPLQPGTTQPGTQPPTASVQAAPSLYGYEALPEAYLAPPQPGQPRYGVSPHDRGRPLAGRPGYGQPAAGQSGYGRAAPARPGIGAASRRDPALAPPWQRLAAQTIDWIIIFAVSVIVFWSQLSVVWRQVQVVTGRYPDLTTPAAQKALDSISGSTSNQHALLYWFLGVFGIALVYYWVQHAAWGATVGKLALRLRVVRAADRSRLGVLMAGVRAVAFLLGPAIFLLLISPFNVIGGVLWAADAGLPLLDSRAQSLHDKVAGTIVVRQRALDESARRSSTW